MDRIVLKSKIHRIKVTDKNLYYEGSIGIDKELLKEVDIFPGEIVQVINLNTGARFETYVDESPKGVCSLQGGAARLGEVGDELIILSYCIMDSESAQHYTPKIVHWKK